MARYNLHFCSTFGYPTRVQEQLSHVLDVILESGVNLKAIFVTGSTARGELAYLCDDKSFRLFSDYEFLLITQQVIAKGQRDLLERKVNQVGEQLNPNNPLFHVDLAWYPLAQLPKLAHTIAIFEQKETGKLLFGEDVRHLMPDITVTSLDQKNANEILYKRLWAMLLYLPVEFYHSQLTPESKSLTTYVLARNALDLSTVLLPSEGVLLPTYSQRVEYLSANYEHLNLSATTSCTSFGRSTSFGGHFPAFLSACLASRQTLSWNGSLLALYRQVVSSLEEALWYLLVQERQRGEGRTEGQALSDLIQAESAFLFDEALPRRAKLKHTFYMLQGRRSLLKALKWAQLPHKGLLTACLLQIHRSMIAHLSGEPKRAWAALCDAHALLDALISRPLSPLDPQTSFLHHWLALRQDCGYFWWEFMRRRRSLFYERIQTLTESLL